MGIEGVAKTYTVKTYPEAFVTTEQASAIRLPPMVIVDFNFIIKYIGEFQNGEEFMRNQVVSAFAPYFANKASLVMLVFDTKTPINKYEEHQARYAKVATIKVPNTIADLMLLLTPTSRQAVENRLHQLFVACSDRKATETRVVRSDGTSDWGANGYPASMTSEDVHAMERERIARIQREVEEKLLTNDPASLFAVTDLAIPIKSMWSSTMSNPQLKRELLHYMTCKLVHDPADLTTVFTSGVYQDKSERNYLPRGFVPPINCTLCIHGGQSVKPSRALQFINMVPQDSSLIAIKASLDESGSAFGSGARVKREVLRADDMHPPSVLARLGEGEISCMYYSMYHRHHDQLIVTGDGDLLVMCLLASRFRFKPDSQDEFTNAVWLHLKVPPTKRPSGPGRSTTKPAQARTTSTTPAAATEYPFKMPVRHGPIADNTKFSPDFATDVCTSQPATNQPLYVNINLLHNSIVNREPFCAFSDPIATYAMSVILCGTDFVKNFAPGMTSGKDPMYGISWFMWPLINNSKAYRELIRIVPSWTHLPSRHFDFENSHSAKNVNASINSSLYYSPSSLFSSTVDAAENCDAHSRTHRDYATAATTASATGPSVMNCDNTSNNNNNNVNGGTNNTNSQQTSSHSFYDAYVNHIEDDRYMRQELLHHKVLLNETLFIQYTKECYFWKYKELKAIKDEATRVIRETMRTRSSANAATRSSKTQSAAAIGTVDGDADDLKGGTTSQPADKPDRFQSAFRMPAPVQSPLPLQETVDIYVDCIKRHLSKQPKAAMMEDSTIIAHARRLKWQLLYWTNAYMNDCVYPNPCETYMGMSYYGWARNSDNPYACHSVNSVSPPKATECWGPHHIWATDKLDTSTTTTTTPVPPDEQHATNTHVMRATLFDRLTSHSPYSDDDADDIAVGQ